MIVESRHEPRRWFEVRSSIPVWRMFEEAEAKVFYLDYSGFEIDWQPGFSPTAAMDLQIDLREAILHLNGHATADAQITEGNNPTLGLPNYCDYLISKGANYPKPVAVDPRYQGRKTDLNIYDPFGNYLVFCYKPPTDDSLLNMILESHRFWNYEVFGDCPVTSGVRPRSARLSEVPWAVTL